MTVGYISKVCEKKISNLNIESKIVFWIYMIVESSRVQKRKIITNLQIKKLLQNILEVWAEACLLIPISLTN